VSVRNVSVMDRVLITVIGCMAVFSAIMMFVLMFGDGNLHEILGCSKPGCIGEFSGIFQ